MTESTRARIRTFISMNFLVAEDAFGDADSMLEKEIMDSTGILELVSFLEADLGITIEEDEVVPANLDSVDAICAFLDRKQLVAGAGRDPRP